MGMGRAARLLGLAILTVFSLVYPSWSGISGGIGPGSIRGLKIGGDARSSRLAFSTTHARLSRGLWTATCPIGRICVFGGRIPLAKLKRTMSRAQAQQLQRATVELGMQARSDGMDEDSGRTEMLRQADEEGRRLHLSKLSPHTDEMRIFVAFSPFEELLEAKIVKPGQGYVLFGSVDNAQKALDRMTGVLVDGSEISVRRARSFYIRKEEQDRMRMIMEQRDREARSSAIARGQARWKDEEMEDDDENEEQEGRGREPQDPQELLMKNRAQMQKLREHPFGVPEGQSGQRDTVLDEDDEDEDEDEEDMWDDYHDDVEDVEDDWGDDSNDERSDEWAKPEKRGKVRAGISSWEDEYDDPVPDDDDDESDFILNPNYKLAPPKATDPPFQDSSKSRLAPSPTPAKSGGGKLDMLKSLMDMDDDEFDSLYGREAGAASKDAARDTPKSNKANVASVAKPSHFGAGKPNLDVSISVKDAGGSGMNAPAGIDFDALSKAERKFDVGEDVQELEDDLKGFDEGLEISYQMITDGMSRDFADEELRGNTEYDWEEDEETARRSLSRQRQPHSDTRARTRAAAEGNKSIKDTLTASSSMPPDRLVKQETGLERKQRKADVTQDKVGPPSLLSKDQITPSSASKGHLGSSIESGIGVGHGSGTGSGGDALRVALKMDSSKVPGAGASGDGSASQEGDANEENIDLVGFAGMGADLREVFKHESSRIMKMEEEEIRAASMPDDGVINNADDVWDKDQGEWVLQSSEGEDEDEEEEEPRSGIIMDAAKKKEAAILERAAEMLLDPSKTKEDYQSLMATLEPKQRPKRGLGGRTKDVELVIEEEKKRERELAKMEAEQMTMDADTAALDAFMTGFLPDEAQEDIVDITEKQLADDDDDEDNAKVPRADELRASAWSSGGAGFQASPFSGELKNQTSTATEEGSPGMDMRMKRGSDTVTRERQNTSSSVSSSFLDEGGKRNFDTTTPMRSGDSIQIEGAAAQAAGSGLADVNNAPAREVTALSETSLPASSSLLPTDDPSVAELEDGEIVLESVVSVNVLSTVANVSSLTTLTTVGEVTGQMDMTYNALLSLLDQRIKDNLKTLKYTVDAQALAARREMILSQLTPEQITYNALIDIFENGVVPMKDVQARLGPRMKETRLNFELSRKWWSIHEKMRNEDRFRVLFAPSKLRRSWEGIKEDVRKGSLDVEFNKVEPQEQASAAEEEQLRKDSVANAKKEWEKRKMRMRNPGSMVGVADVSTNPEVEPNAGDIADNGKANQVGDGIADSADATKGKSDESMTASRTSETRMGTPDLVDIDRGSGPIKSSERGEHELMDTLEPLDDDDSDADSSFFRSRTTSRSRTSSARRKTSTNSKRNDVEPATSGRLWGDSPTGPSKGDFPVSDSSSFAEIRGIIKKEQLPIQTSRKKKADVLEEMRQIWLSRHK